MLRQSRNILDIAQAICARSKRILGFVSQYRVHLLMKGLCRVANSCKPSFIVGGVRRFHAVDDHRCCLLGCPEEPDCLRHWIRYPMLLTSECVSPTAIFDGLSKFCRSQRQTLHPRVRVVRRLCHRLQFAKRKPMTSILKNSCVVESR